MSMVSVGLHKARQILVQISLIELITRHDIISDLGHPVNCDRFCGHYNIII